MLNRTNRTLSAHLNRLNLGTRSLAIVAGLNDGAQTLHTRHAYPVVMRAGMVGVPVDPKDIGRIGIPSIPGSPPVSPWLIVSSAIHPRVDFAAFAFAFSDGRPARSFDPDLPCYRGEEPGPNPTRLRQERGKAVRKPVADQRWQQGYGLAGSWQQATLGPVAAATAVAGG
jgi:hypothetical protein